MKTTNVILLAAVFTAGSFNALAQTSEVTSPQISTPATPPPAQGAADILSADATENSKSSADRMSAALSNASGPVNGGTNGLRLNFNNVPLEMVLKYLSDAAGFHIVMDTQVKGNVTVISSHAMSKDEAVILLNTVLNKNGYAAIRNEQFLTIVDKGDAKNRNIPVIVQSDPALVPNNDIIVTQIIPLRFVEAGQLVKDLSPFVSQSATIIANEAGNSIVITDTQANIRHLCEIIKAIDSSAEASTEIRVFHLQHANPTDVATLLAGVFPSQSSSGNAQTPARFGGGRGGGGGGGGGFGGGPGAFFAQMAANAGGGGAGAQNDRIRKQTQVIAVADLRTSSVVVTAQKDLMDQIDEMIKQIDVTSTRDQKVYVYHLDHGDPQQAASVLQGMFQSSTTSRSGTGSSQNSALQTRETQNATQMGNSSSSSSSALGGNRTSGGGGGGGGRGF